MKLLGLLSAGVAALLGVAATTCPEDDVFTEMTKENLELGVEAASFCALDDKRDATAAATSTTIDLVSRDVPVQPVSYAYQWGASEQLNADVCSVSETIAIDEVGEMPATLHEEVPTAADVINEKVPTTDAKEENVAKADVIDDNVSGSDAPSDSDEEQNVREHDDASTDGMEGQHGNVPGTETGDDADADVKPPATGLEGQHGNVPGTETGDDADADVKPPATGLEAVLRVRKKMRKDPSFRVIFSPGRDVFDPPTLKMSKLSTGFTPTKVVQLTVDTQVRVVSVNAFHVFNGEESWTFIARDREERDLWTNSLVHAIHEAAAFGQDDMDFGEDLATWPSDVLELRTRFRGMQPRKVTLTGNELSICKITKGGKGTKACEAMTLFELSDVIPIDEDKDSKGVTRSLFRVTEYPWKTAKSWTFDAGSPDERAKWIALIEDAILETWAVFEGVEEGNSSDEQDASLHCYILKLWRGLLVHVKWRWGAL